MTLAELARVAGFSTSYVSQVERGLISPSMAGVHGLARALNVPVAAFFESPAKQVDVGPVVRAGDRQRFGYGDSGVVNEIASPAASLVRLVIVKVAPHGSTGEIPLVHGGEESCFVLQGEIELTMGTDRFNVHEGDAFRVVGSVPHGYRNRKRKDAVFLLATTGPYSFLDPRPGSPGELSRNGDRGNLTSAASRRRPRRAKQARSVKLR